MTMIYLNTIIVELTELLINLFDFLDNNIVLILFLDIIILGTFILHSNKVGNKAIKVFQLGVGGLVGANAAAQLSDRYKAATSDSSGGSNNSGENTLKNTFGNTSGNTSRNISGNTSGTSADTNANNGGSNNSASNKTKTENNWMEGRDTRKSFLYPLILSYLGVPLPSEAEPVLNYAFSVFTISLIGLLCFINIIGYTLGFYYLDKLNLEEKTSSNRLLLKILKYFKTTSFLFIIIEIVLCLISFLLLIVMSLFILGIPIYK